MSNAADYPADLQASSWDKKKGVLPTGGDLPDKLKALQKKHEAVGWKLFDPLWSKAAKTLAELDDAYALRDRTYRSSVMALKRDASDVISAAQKLAKDKLAAKPTLDAAKAISAAADKFTQAIDSGLAELASTLAEARKRLPKASEGADSDEEDAAGSALLDPKKLLKQLQACQRDPARRVQFGFVDGKDKAEAVLSLHPRMTGRKLFAALQDQTQVKTGAFGVAWITDGTLFLQLEKPLSGLVKKVRVPIKASGFKIKRVVLATEDGTVIEQDQDTDVVDAAADEGAANAPAVAPADDANAAAAFSARLKALAPRVLAAGTAEDRAQAKLWLSEAGVSARNKDWATATALLDRLDALLDGAPSTSPPAPPVQAPADPVAPAAAAGRTVAPAIVYTQSRLAWSATRSKLRNEMQKLEAAILAIYEGDSVMPRVTQAVRKLDSVLEMFDESLTDALDEALNAQDPAERLRLHGEARGVIDRYQRFLDSDPLVRQLDDNPFIPIAVQSTLSRTLAALGSKIV